MKYYYAREINLARAAGYIDGEGCIQWHLKKNQPKSRDSGGIQFRVNSGDVINLQLLQHLFGGKLKPIKQYGNDRVKCYFWQLHGENAYNALVELLPFLLVKAPQAEAGIGYYREMRRLQGLKQRDAVENLHHVANTNLRLLKKHNYGTHEDDETIEATNFAPRKPIQPNVDDIEPSDFW
jgi:hypothetical protein